MLIAQFELAQGGPRLAKRPVQDQRDPDAGPFELNLGVMLGHGLVAGRKGNRAMLVTGRF